MMENDQKLGLYEVYGDTNEDIVENISQNTEDSGKNLPIEEETEILKENIRIPIDCDGDGIIDGYDTNGDGMIDEWKEIGPRNGIIPYYAKPEFNWNNKNAWINDQNAVNFWLNSKGGTFRELTRIKNENDNIKTY
jgi:hypothetical protein